MVLLNVIDFDVSVFKKDENKGVPIVSVENEVPIIDIKVVNKKVHPANLNDKDRKAVKIEVVNIKDVTITVEEVNLDDYVEDQIKEVGKVQDFVKEEKIEEVNEEHLNEEVN